MVITTDSPTHLKKCAHCKSNPPTIPLRGSLVYCDDCWNDINQRKSEKMLSLNIKRSPETRAAMSASKRANRKTEPVKWSLFHDFYLSQLKNEESLKNELERRSLHNKAGQPGA